MSGLTPKQQKFADEYIITGNAMQSAINAGYSNNYAKAQSSKLLENVGIQDYIRERNRKLESEKIADMKEIKEFWTGTFRDKENDIKDRLKASEFIAKTNGAFIDKQELSGGLNNTITQLTPEERKARIERLKGKLNAE